MLIRLNKLLIHGVKKLLNRTKKMLWLKHDLTLYHQSNIENTLRNDDRFAGYFMFGDPAYPTNDVCICPFGGAIANRSEAENRVSQITPTSWDTVLLETWNRFEIGFEIGLKTGLNSEPWYPWLGFWKVATEYSTFG